MGDQKRAWCGDRARGGKAMDVGRVCVLHGASLCLHARCIESLQLAALSSWCVRWVHVSRDCVTSVSSSSLLYIAFTLRGLPELVAVEVSLYILRIESRPNAIGVGAKAQYHLRGGGRNSESLSTCNGTD